MAEKKTAATEEPVVVETKYTKEQLLLLGSWTGRERDLLEIAIKPGQKMTLKQAKAAVAKAKGGLL